MTRIELSEQQQMHDLQKKLDKMETQIKSSRRPFFGCFHLILYFVIIVILFSGFAAYAIARSGLVDVPFFTAKFYTQPKPVYQVDESTDLAQQKIISNIKNQVLADFMSGKTESHVKIPLSDAYLTLLLKQALAGRSVSFAQVAIDGQAIEVFVQPSEKLFLVANLLPALNNGQVVVDFQSLKLGDLPIPKVLGNSLFKIFVANIFNKALSVLNSVGRVEKFTLEPHQLDVDFVVTNKSNLLNVF